MVRKNTAEAKAEASKRDEVKARIVAEALEAVENALLSDCIFRPIMNTDSGST